VQPGLDTGDDVRYPYGHRSCRCSRSGLRSCFHGRPGTRIGFGLPTT
jgi:hypothetical protein